MLESTAAYGRGAHPELDREIVAAAGDLVERDGAEVVLLTGAVMAGVPARLQPDVAGAARRLPRVRRAAGRAARARSALPKPRAGSYAAPAGRELVDVDAGDRARASATRDK